MASGGTDDDGWTGSLALSGSMSVAEFTGGSFSYQLSRTGAPSAATAKTTVIFSVPTFGTGTGASTGGGRGDGALDDLVLLLLGALGLRRVVARTSYLAV